jgi:hypothetical protein
MTKTRLAVAMLAVLLGVLMGVVGAPYTSPAAGSSLPG